MKKIKILLTAFFTFLFASNLIADHKEPRIAVRQAKDFAQLSQTGLLQKRFKVNFDVFGEIPNEKMTSKDNPKFNKLFKDKFNLAAIVFKNDEIIYERYNKKRGFDSNFPMQGMSMSKTAAAAAIGSLLCDGRIKSLDDIAGSYSETLNDSPYKNIKIKDILQMNSGVSPLGRVNEREIVFMGRQIGQYENDGGIRKSVNFYNSASRSPGSGMNYHPTDSFALSVLVQDIAGESAAKVFYKNVLSKAADNPYMQWTADKEGLTITYGDLTMTPRTWLDFGKYILSNIQNKTCLGNFFIDGINNAISDTREKIKEKYGYHFWVYEIDGIPSVVLKGHYGHIMSINHNDGEILLLHSSNSHYKSGKVMDVERYAEEI